MNQEPAGPQEAAHQPEEGASDSGAPHYILRLYVAGMSPRSMRAISNIRQICEEYLQGRYDLAVIDLYQQPSWTAIDQIIALPTLVKRSPLPIQYLIGDLSDRDRVLLELSLTSG